MPPTIATFADLARPRLTALGRVWRHLQTSRTSLIAAGCAFYATLALFPGLSALLSLYGLMFRPQTILAQLDVIRDLLPPEAYTLIAKRVQALVSHSPRHLEWSAVIGIAAALASASTGAKALLTGIDHMHGTGRRSMLRAQLVSLLMTIAALAAALLALAIMVALPDFLPAFGLSPRAKGLTHSLSFAVLIVFVAAAIAGLYRFGPAPSPGRIWPVLPGALAATPLWVAASEIFSTYVIRLTNLDVTYGPLAAMAGVMLWFWVTSYVLLLGAAINVAVEASPAEAEALEPVGATEAGLG